MSTTTADPSDRAADAAIAAIRGIATDLSENEAEQRCLEDDLLATVQAAMFRESVPPGSRQAALDALVSE